MNFFKHIKVKPVQHSPLSIPESGVEDNKHKDNIILGMGFAALAYFILSVMTVFSKLLSEHHTALEVGFYRNLIAFLPYLFFVYGMGHREVLEVKQSPMPLIMRASLGTISLILTFSAYAYLPMTDATALLFSSSLFLPVLSYFFLKEHVGPYRWSAIFIGLIGVLIMTQPGQHGGFNIGIAYALSAAFMHGVLGTLLRHLGKTESPLTVTYYFLGIGTFFSAFVMPFVAVTPTWGDIPLMLGVGITGALGQLSLSHAFKHAPASLITIFNYTGIIWSTLFGFIIWNDWPSVPVFIGGGIVILANVFIVWREYRLSAKT